METIFLKELKRAQGLGKINNRWTFVPKDVWVLITPKEIIYGTLEDFEKVYKEKEYYCNKDNQRYSYFELIEKCKECNWWHCNNRVELFRKYGGQTE